MAQRLFQRDLDDGSVELVVEDDAPPDSYKIRLDRPGADAAWHHHEENGGTEARYSGSDPD